MNIVSQAASSKPMNIVSQAANIHRQQVLDKADHTARQQKLHAKLMQDYQKQSYNLLVKMYRCGH